MSRETQRFGGIRKHGQRLAGCGGLVLACWLAAPAMAAAPRVELEVLTDADAPPTAAHRWLEVLKDVGFSGIRIRAAQEGDKAEIQQRGTEAAPSYHVTGVLSRNMLLLPGGQFGPGDRAAITKWLSRLQEGGAAGLFESRGTFGLTAKELVGVHDALKTPVLFNTKGQRSFEILKRIAGTLKLSFSADAEARALMDSPEPVGDELRGLTAGTALAAVLRPLGLVFAPQKQGGDIKLVIADVRRLKEAWPVGWPTDKNARETLPDLFTFLNVEFQDTPLPDVLDAISERLKAPLLFDYNALARQRIEPEKVKITLPPKRMYYQQVLSQVLYQAKLKSDLRLDEREKPFLWISASGR